MYHDFEMAVYASRNRRAAIVSLDCYGPRSENPAGSDAG